MTSKNNNDDALAVLMAARDALDAWRVLVGLPRKYGGTPNEVEGTPNEVEEHAAHGRKFFSGADCTCPICVKYRQDQEPPVRSMTVKEFAFGTQCSACHGTKKILEDHDGRAGYRPCTECV